MERNFPKDVNNICWRPQSDKAPNRYWIQIANIFNLHTYISRYKLIQLILNAVKIYICKDISLSCHAFLQFSVCPFHVKIVVKLVKLQFGAIYKRKAFLCTLSKQNGPNWALMSWLRLLVHWWLPQTTECVRMWSDFHRRTRSRPLVIQSLVSLVTVLVSFVHF